MNSLVGADCDNPPADRLNGVSEIANEVHRSNSQALATHSFGLCTDPINRRLGEAACVAFHLLANEFDATAGLCSDRRCSVGPPDPKNGDAFGERSPELCARPTAVEVAWR